MRSDKKKLLAAFLITAAVMAIEFIGGFFSNSLGLISDALHASIDTFALGCAFWASGKHKHEIWSAFINGVILIGMSFFVFSFSVERIFNPAEVQCSLMTIIAFFGLTANLVQFFILHMADRKNINIKGAVRHVVSDTMFSIIIVAGGICIYFTSWFFLDAVLGLIFSPMIFFLGVGLIKDSVKQRKEGG